MYLVAASLTFLVLILSSPVYAQKTSGQITGTVIDQNGAALPDATVTVTQSGTGFSREVKSNDDGNYTVQDLPIGLYRVTATHAGFKEAIVERVTVNVASITRQDVTMQVGDVGERVEVVATDVQIESETGTVGGVVTGEQVQSLSYRWCEQQRHWLEPHGLALSVHRSNQRVHDAAQQFQSRVWAGFRRYHLYSDARWREHIPWQFVLLWS
jgi:hypothetical protein